MSEQGAENVDIKTYEISMVNFGKKRKRRMEFVDSIIVRGQQNFKNYNQLNPIEVKIEDDKILNTLNKYKSTNYQFLPVGLLFSSGRKNTSK